MPTLKSQKVLKFPFPASEVIVSATTLDSLPATQMLRNVDGDGHLRDTPNAEIEDRTACKEQRLFEARESRPPGTTMGPPVATVLLRNDIVGDFRVGVLSKAVVRHTRRGSNLAPITAAAPVARQIVVDAHSDGLQFVAFTAVSLADNNEVVSSLIRIGAVVIPENAAHTLHPALGARQQQIEAVARAQFGLDAKVFHWLFTDAAILYLLGIVHQATSEDGYLLRTGENIFVRTRIGGDLADPMVREVISGMIHGKYPLPIEVLGL
jgi:hypothetical protein